MKKSISIAVFLICGICFSQKEKEENNNEIKKDTLIKTEVVNVITSYAPKVSDAFKIKQKPIIRLSKNTSKKKLEYKINSAPVASTFVPKAQTMKTIDIGEKERLFDSYLEVGFGNNTTPFLDLYIHDNTAFQGEFGFQLKGIYSNDPVKTIQPNSSYYNIGLDLNYKQEGRYFDWATNLKATREKYNWYGLPKYINYTKEIIDNLKASQLYSDYFLSTEFIFNDSYIENAKGFIDFFHDDYASKEIDLKIASSFSFPIGRFGLNLEDFKLGNSIEFLMGNFKYNYIERTSKKHQFVTLGINPSYKLYPNKFEIKLGAKGYFSLDMQRKKQHFYIYPDVLISHPIVSKHANIYAGVTGDLISNNYKNFTKENYHISPTINILQTNNTFNVFGGFKGIISNNINYNIKASYQDEKDKPLFKANPSKSNGSSRSYDTYSFLDYEFGNSFGITYDNVKSIVGYAEVEYDASKELSLGINTTYNKYSLDNEEYAWNLPELTAEVYGMYKTKKWYIGLNVFYIGGRKGVTYEKNTPSVINLDGYIDVNISGGYHINSLLSLFIRGNNISNGEYYRFNNYKTQGYQVIGGIVWKFDNFLRL